MRIIPQPPDKEIKRLLESFLSEGNYVNDKYQLYYTITREALPISMDEKMYFIFLVKRQ